MRSFFLRNEILKKIPNINYGTKGSMTKERRTKSEGQNSAGPIAQGQNIFGQNSARTK